MLYYNSTLKRQNQAKKLYRELFDKLRKEAFKNELDNADIKLRISFKSLNTCYAKTFIKRYSERYKRDIKEYRYIIGINLNLLYKTICKKGYTDSYYTNRTIKLASLKHNRKKSLYFVILHELYHVLQREKDIIYKNTKFYNEQEKQADVFALNYVDRLFNTETSKQETSSQEVKTCKACSQEKDITEFRVYKHIRVLNICKVCELKKARARKEAILS